MKKLFYILATTFMMTSCCSENIEENIEVEDAVKAILQKHGVGVREIRFVIIESMDDSWDI